MRKKQTNYFSKNALENIRYHFSFYFKY